MKILFLCVANSARSQMAEGLAKNIFGNNVQIQSAGSEPSGKVHPMAIEALEKIGIDIRKQFSKSIDSLPKEFIQDLDYVVSLCAEEVCPVFLSNAKKLKWSFPDPASVAGGANQQLKAFCEIRDQIRSRLEELKNQID